MDYSVEPVDGVLHPVFHEDSPAGWLRAAMLRDSESYTDDVLALIATARNEKTITEWSGNEVWIEFGEAETSITHQHMFDNAENELAITLSTNEAESLLRSWKNVTKR